MAPDRERALRLAGEFFRGGPRYAEGDLEALEAALFAEEAFGLRLSDAEISPESLGSAEAMASLVAARSAGEGR